MSHDWNCRCLRCERDWRDWITLDEDSPPDDAATETQADRIADRTVTLPPSHYRGASYAH